MSNKEKISMKQIKSDINRQSKIANRQYITDKGGIFL
jgi:hypothetical protein